MPARLVARHSRRVCQPGSAHADTFGVEAVCPLDLWQGILAGCEGISLHVPEKRVRYYIHLLYTPTSTPHHTLASSPSEKKVTCSARAQVVSTYCAFEFPNLSKPKRMSSC